MNSQQGMKQKEKGNVFGQTNEKRKEENQPGRALISSEPKNINRFPELFEGFLKPIFPIEFEPEPEKRVNLKNYPGQRD
jgi:hypothetical protein